MRRCFLFGAALLVLAAGAAAAQERHVFLFDYSGSMKSFYGSAQSANQVLSGLMANQTRDGDQVVVLFFSKADPGQQVQSPLRALEGRRQWPNIGGSNVNERLTQFNRPRGDTDLTAAVEAGKRILGGPGSGRIWLLTDNIQDLGPEATEDTRRFYDFLRRDNTLRAIHCFPIRPQALGSNKGLAFYGIFFSSSADSPSPEAVRQITFASEYLRQLSPRGPLVCRPLALDVRFPQARVKGGRLLITAVEGRSKNETVGGVQLQSLLPSHQVVDAVLEGRLTIEQITDPSVRSAGLRVAVVPGNYSAGSGETTGPYVLRISIPPLQPAWSWQSVLSTTFQLDSSLLIRASKARLRVNQELGQELASVAALTDLPDFFQPREGEITSLRVPVRVEVQYALWRLLMLVGGVAVVLAAAGVGAWGLLQGKKVRIQIDSEPERPAVRLPHKVSASDPPALLGALTWRPLTGVRFRPAPKTKILEPKQQPPINIASNQPTILRLEQGGRLRVVRIRLDRVRQQRSTPAKPARSKYY